MHLMKSFCTHLFPLLRLSLGTSSDAGDLSALTGANWEALVDFSFTQGVAALAAAAENCWNSIMRLDLEGFARHYRESFEAQIAMFPAMIQGPVESYIEKYSVMDGVMAKSGEKVCISGRSIGDINVQLILEKMGGGGHITLAGAQLEGFSLEDAKAELIIRINEYLLESE